MPAKAGDAAGKFLSAARLTTRHLLIATLIFWGSSIAGLMDRQLFAQPEARQVERTGGDAADQSANSDDAEVSPESTAAVQELIAKLDSPQWEVRRKSTEQLAKAGIPSIQPLLAKLTGECSLEVQTRGIKVLQQIADSNEAAAEQAAIDALQSIAASRDQRLNRHALVALRSVAEKFNDRTVVELKALGAVFGGSSTYGGNGTPLARNAIKFGEKWRGTPDDLRRLSLLTSVNMIEITGKTFDDEFMKAIGKHADPEGIWLDHVNMTEKGFESLSALKNLREAIIWYTPVSDASLKIISTWQKLNRLQLFGTGLQRESSDLLAEKIPGIWVDYKQGALLGVRADTNFPPTVGVRIVVTPGSAASKGNIQSADIITSFDGKKIGDFPDLQEAIADKAAGDSVVVGILTNNGAKPAERTITLGAWEKD